MRPAIAVENLSKRFPVNRGSRGPAGETFLALDGLSFEIAAGQAVGIVGNNGAGKSTLLKILARILRPTSGRAVLDGRVGSLLEVGTGFHPELSGRDNIFLAAAVLGMKQAEIQRRLDAIIDFSGVGLFLDSPVKQYSSGMYMRLAFAIAAHVEPEILLVDEVLAVGDAQFQKKCLERMENLSRNGQTILFVSHSIQSVARLCRGALWIEHGKLRRQGPVAEVAADYLKQGAANPGEQVWPDATDAPGDEYARLRRVRVADASGQTAAGINIGEPFTIEFDFDVIGNDVTGNSLVLFPIIRIFNESGTELIWSTDAGSPWHGKPRPRGRHRCAIHFPAHLLGEGLMSVTVAVSSHFPAQFHFNQADALHFQAAEVMDGRSARGDYPDSITSALRPLLKWTIDVDPKAVDPKSGRSQSGGSISEW
jgi:lipopolysaccharide transport system ATP-binding protein